MSEQSEARVKKIKAYPFPALMDVSGVKKPVQIVYAAPIGVIVTLGLQFVHVGDHCLLEFELPTMRVQMQAKMRVLKTYDKAIDPREHKVERMAELQFENLTKEQKANIVAFAKAIGQK